MSARSGAARAALVARAREELPRPGDPRRLMDDLAAIEDVDASTALEVVARTSLAWRQLRDLGLERSWQNGFGWFLARNLMVTGIVGLVAFLASGVPLAYFEAALAGAGGFYLVVLALSPLRLRRHRHREAGILQAYGRDLEELLDGLGSDGR